MTQSIEPESERPVEGTGCANSSTRRSRASAVVEGIRRTPRGVILGLAPAVILGVVTVVGAIVSGVTSEYASVARYGFGSDTSVQLDSATLSFSDSASVATAPLGVDSVEQDGVETGTITVHLNGERLFSRAHSTIHVERRGLSRYDDALQVFGVVGRTRGHEGVVLVERLGIGQRSPERVWFRVLHIGTAGVERVSEFQSGATMEPTEHSRIAKSFSNQMLNPRLDAPWLPSTRDCLIAWIGVCLAVFSSGRASAAARRSAAA